MDYFCFLGDHKRAGAFAKKHNIRVIHDAAHSFGAKYQGRMIGSFSDITMFSFDPVKSVTCIDGGALVVRTKEELEMIHELRLIGMTQPSTLLYQNQRAYSYDVRRVGFRYHLANLHAAIGLAQIAKIQRIAESRRAACRYYSQRLGGIPEVRLPETDFTDVIPFLYHIRVPVAKRDALRKHLLAQGVDTGIHWPPGHWFTLLKDSRQGSLAVTDRIVREIISLPLHSVMAVETQDKVMEAIRGFFDGQ
jgi:dTDP-4-amino-4,6-dideoxygalactose transaminase